MYGIETAVDWIASNEQVVAPLVALLAAILLYGVLGKRFLGADARFWLRLRRWALPKLDGLGSKAGLYAEGSSGWNEYAGTAYVDALADFEQDLEAMGYLRNPPAALKEAPDGRLSKGSWARRYGYIDGTGRWLKRLGDAPDLVPGTGWVEHLLGNLLVGLSDILALRQRHVTLYVRELPAFEGKLAVDVFVHDEPNSINPLTAWKHYRPSHQDEDDLGGVWDADEGVQGFRDDVVDAARDFAWADEGIAQDGADFV